MSPSSDGARRDPELVRLLVLELERHARALEGSPSPDEVRRALHAMKGSVGLAGEAELASALQRLERRHVRGDEAARAEALEVVRLAVCRLREGRTALDSVWPLPPRDLEPGPVSAGMHAEYMSSIADRFAALDAALRDEDPATAAEAVYRHLHTVKGAASAVGDEVMAWFCHGLEGEVRKGLRGEASLEEAIALVARYRAVLSGLLEDPARTLELLRARAPTRETEVRLRTARPSTLERETDTIRIEQASVDALLDGFAAAGAVRDGVSARASADGRTAADLRSLRAELTDALRLIGPPRPWGVPAVALRRLENVAKVLARAADDLERRALDGHDADVALRDLTASARRELLSMRQTPVRELFARISAAVTAEARRAGRDVQVVLEGADETLDRRLVERLLDPCLALARNAIAHGIEPAAQRAALGKPPTATVTLNAHRTANRLVIGVRDDGAGVDMDALREQALASGAISPSLAEAADDETLLALLFLPGFSTHTNVDLLAGRGIGLDLALSAVERLGGTLRVESQPGRGVEARIDVPIDAGLASVLWVHVHDAVHAILASQVLTVDRAPSSGRDLRAPHVAACLEPGDHSRYAYVLELTEGGADAVPFFVGVDAISGPDAVLVRPVGPLVLATGPYSGAVLLGDGVVRLVLDVPALALRVRALSRVADSVRLSEPPRSLA